MDWSEIIKQAVILGEATGYLTFNQINELITGPEKLEQQHIDALMRALNDRDIHIVDD